MASNGALLPGTAHSLMIVAMAAASVLNPDATKQELQAEPLAETEGQRQA
jgi:hypothetical protein